MKTKISMDDISIDYFVSELNNLLNKETFAYTFFDFERVETKEKNKIYEILEKLKNNKSYMKQFCDEISSRLLNYDMTNVCNIMCGKTYKHKNRTDIPIQISNGYYYSFTVTCKKKSIVDLT